MAQYEITYSCGHNGSETLFGSYAERERRTEWLKGQKCPECRKAASEASKAAANKAAAEGNTGMVALTGSEKQIAWAESIRASKAQHFADIERQTAEKANEAQKAIVAKALASIRNQAAASWWIEHREQTGFEMVREAARNN